MITTSPEQALSSAQTEFNRLMKRLENARAKHAREKVKLDDMLRVTSRELVPLVETFNQTDLEILREVAGAFDTVRLSRIRREGLEDLVCRKAENLLHDQVGMSEKDLAELEALIGKFDSPEDELSDEDEAEEFDFLRGMMESVAAQAGLDLDLTDLDPGMVPEEFEGVVHERLQEAADKRENGPQKPGRKKTKAQIGKERRLKEQEEAKKRDLKSLYKQLAKALHPDLETDATLKSHKEVWMKRLTTAYSGGDLRELLQIEMEWLGEEATNLASAGDKKLKVYSAVLKEQIAEQKRQTDWLIDEPQYFALRRFTDPYTGKPGNPARIRKELEKEIHHYREMLESLRRATKTDLKKRLEAMADQQNASAISLSF